MNYSRCCHCRQLIPCFALFLCMLPASLNAQWDRWPLVGLDRCEVTVKCQGRTFLVGEPFLIFIEVAYRGQTPVRLEGGNYLDVSHGLMVLEISRDGLTFQPAEERPTCCECTASQGSPHPARHSISPTEGFAGMMPGEVWRQMHWNLHPGFARHLASPGHVYMRLRWRGKLLGAAEHVQLTVEQDPAVANPLREFMLARHDGNPLDSLRRAIEQGSASEQSKRTLERITQGITDPQARRSFQSICELFDVPWSHADLNPGNRDLLSRLDRLADSRDFHLRYFLLRKLEHLYDGLGRQTGDLDWKDRSRQMKEMRQRDFPWKIEKR